MAQIRSVLKAPTPGWQHGRPVPPPPSNFPRIPERVRNNPELYLSWLGKVATRHGDDKVRRHATILLKREYFARQKEANQVAAGTDLETQHWDEAIWAAQISQTTLELSLGGPAARGAGLAARAGARVAGRAAGAAGRAVRAGGRRISGAAAQAGQKIKEAGGRAIDMVDFQYRKYRTRQVANRVLREMQKSGVQRGGGPRQMGNPGRSVPSSQGVSHPPGQEPSLYLRDGGGIGRRLPGEPGGTVNYREPGPSLPRESPYPYGSIDITL